MHAVIDRPRATGLDRAAPRPRGQGKGSGYRGFHPALNDRCELALAEHLAAPAASPAWQRAADAMALAGRIVTAHGMPARHAAARQQLAGFLGVYDRFFRLPAQWKLAPATAPGSPLTWRTAAGDAVVDVVRTAPPSHPLLDADVHTRLAELATWAADCDVRLVGVRLLALSAPATSLLHDLVTGTVEALAGTALAGQLRVPGGVSR
ncbi:UNVERIFIED_ORG: hypothetical protein E4P37_12620 [Bacillus sp. AZ43]